MVQFDIPSIPYSIDPKAFATTTENSEICVGLTRDNATDKKLFDYFDTNHNETIDETEFNKFVTEKEWSERYNNGYFGRKSCRNNSKNKNKRFYERF